MASEREKLQEFVGYAADLAALRAQRIATKRWLELYDTFLREEIDVDILTDLEADDVAAIVPPPCRDAYDRAVAVWADAHDATRERLSAAASPPIAPQQSSPPMPPNETWAMVDRRAPRDGERAVFVDSSSVRKVSNTGMTLVRSDGDCWDLVAVARALRAELRCILVIWFAKMDKGYLAEALAQQAADDMCWLMLGHEDLPMDRKRAQRAITKVVDVAIFEKLALPTSRWRRRYVVADHDPEKLARIDDEHKILLPEKVSQAKFLDLVRAHARKHHWTV